MKFNKGGRAHGSSYIVRWWVDIPKSCHMVFQKNKNKKKHVVSLNIYLLKKQTSWQPCFFFLVYNGLYFPWHITNTFFLIFSFLPADSTDEDARTKKRYADDLDGCYCCYRVLVQYLKEEKKSSFFGA